MPARATRSAADARSTDAAPATTTRTVERALDLLEAAAVAPDGLTLTEIAGRTGLSASTASRLLATLQAHWFVARTADQRFRSGPRLRQLAVGAMRVDPLYELAGPHLAALAAETRETANVGVALDADRVLYLRQHAGPQFVRVAGWTGRSIPRRGTALGAALAGEAGEGGFVVRRSAVEPDVVSIAAPIRGDGGAIVGALSVLAPSYRTTRARERAHGRRVAAHARELSERVRAGGATMIDNSGEEVA
ncbi:MAG TPA: helix-turn-helix domain-containing protein [Solirubrobacteraceae bacterium]|nr:helix-turn-helix domain-containing protein [Solirubrobacteraceae bacterium]